MDGEDLIVDDGPSGGSLPSPELDNSIQVPPLYGCVARIERAFNQCHDNVVSLVVVVCGA